jgi:predicted metal-dependent hydrolase
MKTRNMYAVRGRVPQLSLFPAEDLYLQPGSMAVETPAAPAFSVRESARARRLSIKVYPRGKVEVVVPKRTRPGVVAAFVAENKDWIRQARDSFAAEHSPEPFALPQSIVLPAVDRVIEVRYVKKPGSSVKYRFNGNCLTLSGQISNEKACISAIRRWLGVFARQEFGPRLTALSEMTDLPYSRMQVRAQRTCWGSRSSTGTLSLNLCLLFLRPELMRYLMIHELCHGRHMNHSKRFWGLVGRFEPDYRLLDRELTECWKSVPVWLGIY